jgi:hypothetical protein
LEAGKPLATSSRVVKVAFMGEQQLVALLCSMVTEFNTSYTWTWWQVKGGVSFLGEEYEWGKFQKLLLLK